MRKLHFMSLFAVGLLLLGCDQGPPTDGRRQTAISDSDGDGVSDMLDACEGTSTDRVTATGCPDDDLDGVTDEDDQCPQTAADAPVDANGCPFPASDVVFTGEYRIRRFATPAEIEKAIVSLTQLKHPTNCPGDVVAPPTPTVTEPSLPGVMLDRAFVLGGPNPITVRWTAVEDSCAPIRYGIEWEYRWMGTRGPWQPLVGLGSTKLDVTEHTIDWPLIDTAGRFRVWAMDGNGHTSARSAWRYVLLDSLSPPSQPTFWLPVFP